MKNFTFFILALTACTSSATREVSDSPSVADTAVHETTLSDAASIPESVEVLVSDTGRLEARYDEVSQANETDSENWHSVYISTNQYESGSDVVWHFDDSLSPRYFKMTWSAEGREGSTEVYIQTNAVVCSKEEEENELSIWCSTTGGTRTRWREDDSIGTKELLPADYGSDSNASFRRYLDILKSILKEGELTEKDENTYTVRIEKTVNYGVDFTESTEVTIPKKVYNAIKD